MGFVTLLGSAEKADKVIAQIKKDAAQTPFELKGLIEANQALTAVTKNGMRSEKILLDVGKALSASGKGQPELDRMIANLQQIGLTGQITQMDIRQFGMSGINILELLADYYGTTTAEAGEMVKESKDGFGDLEKAFEKAGKAGGKFANAFENQKGTFNQSLSNMKDSLAIFASDFVKNTGIFDFAKKAMQGFTEAIDNNKQKIYDLVDSFKELAKQAIKVGKEVYEYLRPKIQALWANIKEELIPALKDLWFNVLKPLIPVIGVALVASIGLVIDAVNIMVEVFGTFSQWIRDANPVLMGFIAAFVALKAVMVFNAVVNAIIVQFNLLKLVHIPSLITSFGLLRVAVTSPMMVSVIGIGAAVAALAWLKGQADATRWAVERAIGAHQKAADISAITNQTNAFGGQSTAGLSILGGAGLSQTNFKAVGGTVNKNRPYIVGERGPEMFIPRGAGTIKTDKETAKMGGSTVFNGNINIGNQGDALDIMRILSRNQSLAVEGL